MILSRQLNDIASRASVREQPNVLVEALNGLMSFFIPYKPFYQVHIGEFSGRFSKYVLDTIRRKKIIPSAALEYVLSMKPRIKETSFCMSGIDYDIVLTQIILREMMPPYLIYPLHGNSERAKLNSILQGEAKVNPDITVIMLEELSFAGEFLNALLQRIKE